MPDNANDRERALRAGRRGQERLAEQEKKPSIHGLPYCSACAGWHSSGRGCR